MEEATPETEAPTTGRPRRANDLGPTGTRVAENVKALRESLPLTTEQLAERVTGYGRPMRANTITKIEKMQRRVDVDDLVALALALETRPTALLLPHTIAIDEFQITEGKTDTAYHAWRWMDGERPLDLPEDDDGTAYNRFQMRAQPVGLRGYKRTDPREFGPGVYHEGKFHPMSEGDTSGERSEEAER
ncbi:helix-turn-helix transcriptional regulator [Streptomyces mirabilis]